MSESPPAAVVVLAAGHGTRMRSVLPKVLHAMLGRSLVEHVLAATAPLAAPRTVVVIGAGQDEVRHHLAERAPDATPVVQDPPRGTADAVAVALAALDPDLPETATVVVTSGDCPLLTASTLQSLVDRHHTAGAAATVLSARVPDPTGYGRVVRDGDGQVAAIVEHRDADPATREIDEVNAAVYAFALGSLRAALDQVVDANAQGELYLTDVIGLLVAAGDVVTSVVAPDYREILGVNDRVQLATARRLLRDRVVEHWMREGVTVIDPQTTWIGVHAVLEPDCVIHQNTQLHGTTSVASFAEVGPDTTLRSTVVGRGARVVKSQCSRSEIGQDTVVGPYAHLRAGTRLGAHAKAGAFVETKQVTVGDGSKIPHLSYVGDATVGRDSNIGCGAVTVNYDGVHKHPTVIGDNAFIGCDTMLVAPVTIGDGATTGAGAVVRADVPPGALAVSANDQRTIEDWAVTRRPDSRQAAAAARARAAAVPAAHDQHATDEQFHDEQSHDEQGAAQ